MGPAVEPPMDRDDIVLREPPIERDLETRTGLRAGDVILQINRRRVESAEQAAAVFRRASGSVAIYLERNGEVIVRRLLFRGTGG